MGDLTKLSSGEPASTNDISEFLVRAARVEDAPAIAYVHAEGWNTSYRGVLPDAAFVGHAFDDRLAQWAPRLQQPTSAAPVLVAEIDGTVVGFTSGGPSRSPDLPYVAELYAIYVLLQAQRRGVGRALFVELARRLCEDGAATMLLWVLAANEARRFYERMGGGVVAEREERFGTDRVAEVAYGFHLPIS
jgi:GNAT superfamily N-acetyltransferase